MSLERHKTNKWTINFNGSNLLVEEEGENPHHGNMFPISPGYYSPPKRNPRQWLRKIWEGKQGALWSM